MRWKMTLKLSLLFALFALWAMMAGQPAWGPVAPVINSVTPNPTFAGDTITVTGTGFGTTQGVSLLYYDNDDLNLTVTSWSDTQIRAVLVTPKAVGTYGVHVVTEAGASNIIQHTINMDVPPWVIGPILQMMTSE